MKGRRVYPDKSGNMPLREGDYGFRTGYGWVVRPPGCHAGGIPDHQVTEHEDGTITVSPSILLTEDEDNGEKQGQKVVWHGYLEHGEWRAV